MNDREKVIKGLEVCTANVSSCDGCPYFEPVETIGCDFQMMKDALALLREQEPVEPHYKELAILGQWDSVPICGACGTIIGYSVKYCPHCGREVGWSESRQGD